MWPLYLCPLYYVIYTCIFCTPFIIVSCICMPFIILSCICMLFICVPCICLPFIFVSCICLPLMSYLCHCCISVHCTCVIYTYILCMTLIFVSCIRRLHILMFYIFICVLCVVLWVSYVYGPYVYAQCPYVYNMFMYITDYVNTYVYIMCSCVTLYPNGGVSVYVSFTCVLVRLECLLRVKIQNLNKFKCYFYPSIDWVKFKFYISSSSAATTRSKEAKTKKEKIGLYLCFLQPLCMCVLIYPFCTRLSSSKWNSKPVCLEDEIQRTRKSPGCHHPALLQML